MTKPLQSVLAGSSRVHDEYAWLDEQSRRVLAVFLLIAGCAGLLVTLRILLLGDYDFVLGNLFALFFAVICFVGWGLLKASYLRAAFLWLVWAGWALISFWGFLVMGVRTPALYLYPLFIMLAAWLGGLQLTLTLVGATIGITTLMLWGERAGWLVINFQRTATEYSYALWAAALIVAATTSFIRRAFDGQFRRQLALAEELQKKIDDLQRLEKRFVRLFRSNPTPSMLTREEDGAIYEVNPAWEKLFGWAATEVVGCTTVDIGLWPSEQKRQAGIGRLHASGDSDSSQVVELRRRDGVVLRCLVAVERIDMDGERGMVVSVSDQTAYLQVQDEMRRSRAELEGIIDNLPAIVYVKDRDGRYLYVNRQWSEFFGTSREQVCGKTDQELFPEAVAQRFMTVDRQVLSSGNTVDVREEAPLDGDLHAYRSIKAALKDGNGVTDRLIGISLDITAWERAEAEARAAEQKFRDIFDNAPFGIFQSTVAGKFIRCNRKMAEQFGYVSPEAMMAAVGDNARLFAEPEQRARVVERAVAAGADGGNSFFDCEITYRKRDGSDFIASVHMRAVSDVQGGVAYVEGFIEDITAHKEIEGEVLRLYVDMEGRVRERTAQLEQANADLASARDTAEAATRAKSQFLANMSHEIRTPMNAILGMTDLALRTELTAKQRDYLQKTKSAADSLLGVINDILDFSKIEAGKLEVEYSEFRLDDVLEKVANLVSLKAQEKGLEFLLDTAEDVPQMLLGDQLRLRQVLVNLCNNAVKFTERGEIAIVISKLFQTLSGEVVLQFSVRDSGIGLSQAQIDRLFEPFNQVDSSTTRKYGGTGLGLAISKQLVGLMGGEIGVNSQPGVGSDFHFSASFRLLEENRRRLPEMASALRHLRVLVIDDSAHSRKVLAGLLHPLVAAAKLCASGPEGLDELRQAAANAPFDLVLTDLDMPDMDGFAVISEIRQQPGLYGRPKIILVTAYGDEDVQKQASDEGLDAYLNKPVSASTLLDTLLVVCGSKPISENVLLETPGDASECLQRIGGLSVLLVEDNDFNQQVAKELLEGVAGVSVRIAGNGREALDRLQEEEFDLVLMDVQMPEMDGYEATTRIRRERRWRGLPIIAMTAHAMLKDRDKCLQVGMNDYITKPFDPTELFAMLAKWAPVATPSATGQEAAVAPRAMVESVALDGITFELGLQYSFGKVDVLHRLFRMFMETRADSLAEMQAMLDVGDEKGAAMMAHSLKAAAGTIGAQRLSAMAKALERAIDSRQREQLAVLLRDFSDELERVIGGLRAYRSQHPECFTD